MRQLYLTVAVPKFTYGADIWFKPIYDNSDRKQRGSMGVAEKLAKIQRIATLGITGAMRTTATDTLDAHANLLPTSLLLQKICHRSADSALRLATLPQHHPLHKHLQHIAKHHDIRRHRSSLHNLIATYRVFSDNTETLDPIRRSNAKQQNAYNTHIAPKKTIAIREQRELTDKIQIFADGSGHSGGIGAAAVLMREGKEPRTLKYHLGPDKTHTVYEAEVVGLTLAAKLLATEQNVVYPVSILVDNQAAIRSGESHNTNPGSYLVEQFRRMTKSLAKRRRENGQNFDLTIRWVPGHAGVKGNKLADEAAKEAATNEDAASPRRKLPRFLQEGPLPDSVSALKQWHQDDTSVNYNFSHRKYRIRVLVQPATDSTVPPSFQHTRTTT